MLLKSFKNLLRNFCIFKKQYHSGAFLKIAPNNRKFKINNSVFVSQEILRSDTSINFKNYLEYLENRVQNLTQENSVQNLLQCNNIYDLKVSSECDIFTSYKQNNNSDAIAMNIYYSMKMFDIDVWFDKMRCDERSESGMIAGVKSCNLFCAIISPDYFKSNFCILELKTAIKYSKKIALCFNGSKFKIQEALQWIPEVFNYLKQDEIIKLDEDNEYMQVGLNKLCKRLKNHLL